MARWLCYSTGHIFSVLLVSLVHSCLRSPTRRDPPHPRRVARTGLMRRFLLPLLLLAALASPALAATIMLPEQRLTRDCANVIQVIPSNAGTTVQLYCPGTPTTPTPTASPSAAPTAAPAPTVAPAAAPSPVAVQPTPQPSGTVPSGSLVLTPGAHIGAALQSLQPGQTLVLRGGTYSGLWRVTPGACTESLPCRVVAYPGERPIIQGVLHLNNPQHLHFSGINITWGGGSSSDHMLKFSGGSGWSFSNAEVWGARSYAAILVTGTPIDWGLRSNYIHDTYPTNGTNQDHLVYVTTTTLGGIIERNVLANSTNGRGIKIGPSSGSTTPIGGVTIRHNTFFNNTGPSNIQLSYGATNNMIERNLFVRSGDGKTSVTAYNLSGSGNIARNNLWYLSTGIAQSPIVDGGGNLTVDPQLDSTYRPRAALAQPYGAFAGQ